MSGSILFAVGGDEDHDQTWSVSLHDHGGLVPRVGDFVLQDHGRGRFTEHEVTRVHWQHYLGSAGPMVGLCRLSMVIVHVSEDRRRTPLPRRT